MVDKVYCSDCKYFKMTNSKDERGIGDGVCSAPEGLGSWFSKDSMPVWPSDRNKKNDCSWYKKNGL